MNKILALLLICGLATAGTADDATTEAEVLVVLDQYVQAVNEGDIDLLRDILSPPDVASYVNPVARLQTIEQLEAFWSAGIAGRYVQRDLRPGNVTLTTAGDAAWAVFDWEFHGVLADGEPFNATGWETQIYRLTEKGWRLAHVHFSSPPPVPGE